MCDFNELMDREGEMEIDGMVRREFAERIYASHRMWYREFTRTNTKLNHYIKLCAQLKRDLTICKTGEIDER